MAVFVGCMILALAVPTLLLYLDYIYKKNDISNEKEDDVDI